MLAVATTRSMQISCERQIRFDAMCSPCTCLQSSQPTELSRCNHTPPVPPKGIGLWSWPWSRCVIIWMCFSFEDIPLKVAMQT